ncbi:hypothetical protein Fuma_02212 [Fuerstiella marisgermanici]|uniref:Uncharacterized protein n=1 Tax=Fuerstiella marisgermanici TaxID=1891926 RepID=A0A1P8WEZ5_9PLAN|nr:hypothetical protein Fuma_02212 [Fuerstiella marisgermanici]
MRIAPPSNIAQAFQNYGDVAGTLPMTAILHGAENRISTYSKKKSGGMAGPKHVATGAGRCRPQLITSPDGALACNNILSVG